MTFFEAYDALLAAGARPEHAARVAEMRRAFEKRTGALSPGDGWSEGLEARMRAFWDDALATQGFAETMAQAPGELTEEARAWTGAIGRAHRGLFVVAGEDAGARILRDLWSGAELVVHAIDDATRLALAAASAPFDARLVGTDDPPQIAMMPGALFHPADATAPITKVLERARAANRTTGDVLDTLLRMERELRSSARVKAAYAYRLEKL
jgi:hypothetical protein